MNPSQTLGLGVLGVTSILRIERWVMIIIIGWMPLWLIPETLSVSEDGSFFYIDRQVLGLRFERKIPVQGPRKELR